jgi:hypothetical protein
MSNKSRTPRPRSSAALRAQRTVAAVFAQYIHDLSIAGERTPSVRPSPTALGHCWGCA